MIKYEVLDLQGFVFIQSGSSRFRIVSPDLVYFYKFDENYIPKRDNVMFNFMGADSIYIDKESKFFISLKIGQSNMEVIERKYDHGF